MKKIIFSISFLLITKNAYPGTVTVSAIGDIMSHKALQNFALSTDQGYGAYFENTKEVFLNDDLTIGNLETVVDDSLPLENYPRFNSHSALIDAIKESGIEAVSLSNNHTFDQGYSGIGATLQNVRDRGLVCSGTGFTEEEAETPAVFKVNGVKIGMLSLTSFLNIDTGKPKEGRPVINVVPMKKCDQLDNFREIIKKTKENVDAMIVTYHCGDEYITEPSAEQDETLKALADAGADVVLGCHPHVVQKIEYYKTKDGRDVLIAYSLGNFISSQAYEIPEIKDCDTYNCDSKSFRTAEGIILQFEISTFFGFVSVKNPRVIPTITICARENINGTKLSGYRTYFMDDIIDEKTCENLSFDNKESIRKVTAYRKTKLQEIFNDIPIVSPRKSGFLFF